MQVMPFWPEGLGMRRHQLIKTAENIRMGCDPAFLSEAITTMSRGAGALQRHRETLVLRQGHQPVDALERRG
jgi:hypothetical protein